MKRIINALLIFASYVSDGDCIRIHNTDNCVALPSLQRLYPQLRTVCDIEHKIFLSSAPTVNSTMDFSVKPIEEGVVDSPPNSKLCLPVLYSPSPLRLMDRHASTMSPDSSDKGMQRKLYGEKTIPTATAMRTPKVKQTTLPLPTTAPAVALIRQRVLSSQQGRYKRPKQSGSFCMVASTPSYDS